MAKRTTKKESSHTKWVGGPLLREIFLRLMLTIGGRPRCDHDRVDCFTVERKRCANSSREYRFRVVYIDEDGRRQLPFGPAYYPNKELASRLLFAMQGISLNCYHRWCRGTTADWVFVSDMTREARDVLGSQRGADK